MTEFAKHGRRMFGDFDLESRPAKSSLRAMTGGHAQQQIRNFSSVPNGLLGTPPNRKVFNSVRATGSQVSSRAYATTTNPNPPLGQKNASNTQPARVALIGMSDMSLAWRLAHRHRRSGLYWSGLDKPPQCPSQPGSSTRFVTRTCWAETQGIRQTGDHLRKYESRRCAEAIREW